ncbi:MAG: DUF255 domain-containing protein [Balneolaceae bacterium]|nr:DUF255 domain-containing protein [Balneolaceae bacterium]
MFKNTISYLQTGRSMQLLWSLFVSLLLLNNGWAQSESSAERIHWYSMEEAQQLAAENGKGVLLFTEAEWCTYCKKMERDVFPEQTVIRALETHFYPVKLDIESDAKIVFNGTAMTEADFAEKHELRITPTTVFISEEGEMLISHTGYVPAVLFSRLLSYIGSGVYSYQSFEKYIMKADF